MIARTRRARRGLSLAVLGAASAAVIACRSSGAPAPDEARGTPSSPPIADGGDAAMAVSLARDASSDAPLDGALGASALDASVAPPRPGPYGELRDPNEIDSMFEGRIVGYSKDDRYLGYEISTCDPCPEEFHFFPRTGPALSMSYFYQPDLPEAVQEQRRQRNDREVERKLEALGAVKAADGRVLRGPFPPDLVFAVKTSRDEDKGTVTLHFGAHAPGAAPVYPMRIVLGPRPLFHPPKDVRAKFAKLPEAERAKELRDWHEQFAMSDPVLAYANVTKDGKEVGIVALARGTMWWEEGGVARMATDRFIAEVRAAAGTRAQLPSTDAGAP